MNTNTFGFCMADINTVSQLNDFAHKIYAGIVGNQVSESSPISVTLIRPGTEKCIFELADDNRVFRDIYKSVTNYYLEYAR